MMVRRRGLRASVALVATFLLNGLVGFAPASAITPDEAFENVWRSTDAAVASGSAGYSWFWGPEVRDQRSEYYVESPGSQRIVRYYDKSRMEITHPDGDPSTIWYVTNGLLTVELVSGRHQTGDSARELLVPSTAKVAGDQTGNPGTPSYAQFAAYATTGNTPASVGNRTGQAVTDFLSGDATLSSIAPRGVSFASYQAATGHNIADVFWNWANSPDSGLRPDQGVDWLYVLGYPISEPYWVEATVAGTPRIVLVQLFQRRVLTYDTSNPAAYRVEFGNIGQHYYSWLYESNALPDEGGLVYGWDIADWTDASFPYGEAFVVGDTYHHRVEVPDDPQAVAAVFSYLPGIDLRNLSASIKVRFVSGESEYAEACLMVRLPEALTDDYAFCLNAVGETLALHEDNSGELSVLDTLLDYAVRAGTNPTDDWNELQIYAMDDHLWFVINGVLAGDVRHTSISTSGTVGFYTINFDTVPVEVEWADMTVHYLE
ncbi:MAG: hypothetical protein DCC58_11590 [Chloroflexi bacterium]|nr:MAG: hypothetical protein DCC58_11590 [Chloroflexota bacterium]